MATRAGDVRQWDAYSLEPRIRLGTSHQPLAVGLFQEVEYGPEGSWDVETRCLHFAALLTPARHRHGPRRADLVKVVPSTAVARPG